MASLSDLFGITDPNPFTEANPTNQTTDVIEPLGDKPYAEEKVRWSTEKTQEVWRRVDGGLKFQELKFKQTYDDANALWRGEHWPEGSNNNPYKGHLIANLIPNFVKSMVEAVAFTYPSFTVSPWNRVGEANQQVAKAALSYYWREARTQQQLKRVFYDRVLYGFGVCQIGWLFKTEETTLDTGRLPVEPAKDSIYTPEQEADTQPVGESKPKPVAAGDVLEDRFQCRRIDPLDFLVPAEATSVVEEWPWCAKLERRPLVEVKRDKQYKNTSELKGSTAIVEAYLQDDVKDMEDERRPMDVRYVELIHYYEQFRRLHIVLCRENPLKPLLVEKWTWQTGRYPFRTTHGTHTPNEFYGKSMPIELWSMQVDLNECATQVMEARRQFNRMFQTPEDALDDNAIYALEEGKPGTVVEYKQGPWGANPIQPIPHLQIQPEVFKSREISLQTMEQISGLSQYQLHNPPTKRLTANESQAIQTAGGILFMADSGAFETLCEEVAEDLLDWTQQFSEVVKELPIYDKDDDVTAWANFSREAIKGDYLLEVNVGSTQPPDLQQNVQMNQMALQLVGQAMQFVNPQTGAMPRPIAIIINQLLKTIGMKHVDELMPIPPPPPPMPPQMPQMMPGAPGAPGLPPGAGAPPTPQPGPAGPPGPQGAPAIDPQQLQAILNSMPPELIAALLHRG